MSGFRHELKYLISYREKDLIIQRLKDFAGLDTHAEGGQYMIRSLYFDDMHHSAYEEKLSGVVSRKKYRIRIYDLKDEYIRFECKIKRGSYIYKKSAPLSREECDRIISGDVSFLSGRQEEVLQDFYVRWMTQMMRPEVIVDYDRIPYTYDGGTVRITFDMHIRSAFEDYDIFNREVPVYEAMAGDSLIMEVKYTEFMPDIFRSIIDSSELARTSASKFVICDDIKRKLHGGMI